MALEGPFSADFGGRIRPGSKKGRRIAAAALSARQEGWGLRPADENYGFVSQYLACCFVEFRCVGETASVVAILEPDHDLLPRDLELGAGELLPHVFIGQGV